MLLDCVLRLLVVQAVIWGKALPVPVQRRKKWEKTHCLHNSRKQSSFFLLPLTPQCPAAYTREWGLWFNSNVIMCYHDSKHLLGTDYAVPPGYWHTSEKESPICHCLHYIYTHINYYMLKLACNSYHIFMSWNL